MTKHVQARQPYRSEQYWGERLGKQFNLDGVGYLGLGHGLNYWIYRKRRYAVRRALRLAKVSARGLNVAELGAGTGYWVREWKTQGARSVLGVDITQTSVEALREGFPEYRFERCDLGQAGALPTLVRGERFALIAAMEVLLHIVDQKEFHLALDNIASITEAGSYLLLSDLFLPIEVSSHHQCSRTMDTYRAELGARGFHLVRRDPVFFMLHPAHFMKTGIMGSLERLRWASLARLMRIVPALGWLLGAPLFVYDLILGTVVREGPSTHVTLWRRQ